MDDYSTLCLWALCVSFFKRHTSSTKRAFEVCRKSVVHLFYGPHNAEASRPEKFNFFGFIHHWVTFIGMNRAPPKMLYPVLFIHSWFEVIPLNVVVDLIGFAAFLQSWHIKNLLSISEIFYISSCFFYNIICLMTFYLCFLVQIILDLLHKNGPPDSRAIQTLINKLKVASSGVRMATFFFFRETVDIQLIPV